MSRSVRREGEVETTPKGVRVCQYKSMIELSLKTPINNVVFTSLTKSGAKKLLKKWETQKVKCKTRMGNDKKTWLKEVEWEGNKGKEINLFGTIKEDNRGGQR